MNIKRIEGSFRDPSGFLFWKEGLLYRQINVVYKKHYDTLMDSGLYDCLSKEKKLIPHIEEEICSVGGLYKIIRPEIIPLVSYPYEWSFSQLKDAALLTLNIQKIALSHGMILKDASAYNVQFRDGKPIFIDTLSFEMYDEGSPWVAYRQFCQHFLAPLVLMAYSDVRLNHLLKVFIDGIPLDLASRLLPLKSYFRLFSLLHIHLHAKSQKHYEDKIDKQGPAAKKMTKHSLLGIIDGLESGIKKLNWKAQGTEWAEYYQDDSYTMAAFEAKKQKVSEFLDKIKPSYVWDLGANDGFFSRVANEKGAFVASFDIDPACVDNNYCKLRARGETAILPLLLDLTNPSSDIGWDNLERLSLKRRGNADVVMSLALVHHLAISNNISLNKIAKFLKDIGKWLIIEFVPKQDKKVQKLLATRKDIFDQYNQSSFEQEFEKFFEIHAKENIKDSLRVLYLMKNKDG